MLYNNRFRMHMFWRVIEKWHEHLIFVAFNIDLEAINAVNVILD